MRATTAQCCVQASLRIGWAVAVGGHYGGKSEPKRSPHLEKIRSKLGEELDFQSSSTAISEPGARTWRCRVAALLPLDGLAGQPSRDPHAKTSARRTDQSCIDDLLMIYVVQGRQIHW